MATQKVGYLNVKRVDKEGYRKHLSAQGLLDGEVRLYSAVKTEEPDDVKNKTAITVAWAVFLAWLQSGIAPVGKLLHMFCAFYGGSDMQKRGIHHHHKQTGKALAGQGLYAGKVWNVKLITDMNNQYMKKKPTALATPGQGAPPWTLYCTRMASSVTAINDIRKDNRRIIYAEPSTGSKAKIDQFAGKSLLLESNGRWGFGFCIGTSLTYLDIWNDSQHNGEQLMTQMGMIAEFNGKWVVNGTVQNLVIAGVDSGMTFPYTEFWPVSGMVPKSRVEQGTLEANFWADEIRERPQRLKRIQDPSQIASERANMATHGPGWFTGILWPAVVPRYSPFAGCKLSDWEDFPEQAKTLEEIAIKFIEQEKPKLETAMDDAAKGLEEDQDVWRSMRLYLIKTWKSTGMTHELLSKGVVAKETTQDAVAATIQWKSATAHFSNYFLAWGMMRFAPCMFMFMDHWGKKEKPDVASFSQLQDDDLVLFNACKAEHTLLLASGGTIAPTFQEYVHYCRIRMKLDPITSEAELDPLIAEIVKKNKEMNVQKGQNVDDFKDSSDKELRVTTGGEDVVEWVPDYSEGGGALLTALYNVVRLFCLTNYPTLAVYVKQEGTFTHPKLTIHGNSVDPKNEYSKKVHEHAKAHIRAWVREVSELSQELGEMLDSALLDVLYSVPLETSSNPFFEWREQEADIEDILPWLNKTQILAQEGVATLGLTVEEEA